MGLLEDIEGGFSAVINGVEHAAHDLESLVGKAINELESLGIAVTGEIRVLVKFLIDAGEDPVAVINHLRNRIESLGGDTLSTLEELAHGIMTYGLVGFAQKKVREVLAPMEDALRASTARGQSVAQVHRTTLSTMQTKLAALKATGNTSGAAWQGQSVEEMSLSFGNISGLIDGLTVPLEGDGAQARLNQICEQVLVDIVVAGSIILLCEIAATAIVAVLGVETGPGEVVILGGGASLIGATLELLIILIGADLAAWLIGTIIIYMAKANSRAQSRSKDDTGSRTGKGKLTRAVCNKAQKLLKECDRLAQKQNSKINPKRLEELRRKIADKTITSSDLPGSIQSEFPGELKGLTLKEIEALCKGV